MNFLQNLKMINKVKFYIPKIAINEATDFYVKLIEESLVQNGVDVENSFNLFRGVKSNEVIFVIRLIDLFLIKLLNPKAKIITWFQGVPPEECYLIKGRSFKGMLGVFLFNLIEKNAIKKSEMFVFVSEKMKNHFENKYGLGFEDRNVILPCYNKHLDENSFNYKDKYDILNFVYAGGMNKWQCVEVTLKIFKKINKYEKKSNLTLLTFHKEKAEELIDKLNVRNVTVKYVKLEDLQEELKKFKYGFIYRERDIVNQVSTPTKMNSYMAAGVIPIYTNVIESFEENIDLGIHELKFDPDLDTIESISNQIILHHKSKKRIDELKRAYRSIFNNYYNDNMNKQKFFNSFKSIFNKC